MIPRQFAPSIRTGWVIYTVLLGMIGVFAPGSRAQDKAAAECSSCHAEESKKTAASMHAVLTCDTCHDQHTAYPHPKNVEKPVCATCHADQDTGLAKGVHGQALKAGNTGAPDCATCHGSAHEVQRTKGEAFRKAMPDTCGMCHTDVSEKFKSGSHGKALAAGIIQAPVCTDCHGEHEILSPKVAASPANRVHIRETCGRCHGDVRLTSRFGLPADRLTSFDSSFHGLAGRAGSQTVANCASCHGYHDVLPSSDENSMTHPKNLSKTCGACHPGAGERFAISTIHFTEGGQEPGPVRYVRIAYWWIIPITLGLMAVHHLGDFLRKLWALRFRAASAVRQAAVAGEMRMYRFERVQHALLAVSFLVLGWTGFALRYPDAWWARILVMWESSWPVRGTVHRAAAVVLVGCSLAHLVSLVVNKRLRSHWLTLLPKARDVREGLAQMAYNLGLRKSKPKVSAHSYVEKVEYWAVVWGTVVMGISGLLLWFNNWSLQQLPKIWLDVARAVHFYEAVLACLAILIWHFYSVIFDPDVYPMDTAWLTGRTVRRREPETGHGAASPLAVHKPQGEHDSQG